MKLKQLTKKGLLLSIPILAGLLLFSCRSKPGEKQHVAGETISIEHKLGTSTVPVNPERVVVLDIGALETMHELDVKPIGIPKKFLPSYLKELGEDPSIADVGSVIEPDFEAIAASKPDLILISSRIEPYYKELNEIAPAVYIGADTKNYLPSFEHNVNLIADLFQKQELAKQKLDSLKQKVQLAQEKFSKDPNKGMFLIVNNGKFSAFGKGSRFGFIHDVLGIKQAVDLQDESVHGQRVSNEFVAEANPDYLFLVDRNAVVLGKKANRQDVENKLIQQTNAYKHQKIFYLDPEVWFISGGGLRSVNLMLEDFTKLIP